MSKGKVIGAIEMLIIEIVSELKVRKIQTADKSFEIEYQQADLWVDDGRPRPMEIQKPRAGKYARGLYTLSGGSFNTDRYDRLELQYATLEPLADALKSGDLALKRFGKQ